MTPVVGSLMIRVHGGLVLKTLVIREGDMGRSCVVSWVVGNDLNMIALPDTNASEMKRRRKKMRIKKNTKRLNRAHMGRLYPDRY